MRQEMVVGRRPDLTEKGRPAEADSEDPADRRLVSAFRWLGGAGEGVREEGRTQRQRSEGQR